MATTVGLVHLRFDVPQARSLKDKRRWVKSFKDRLRCRMNISVAEVGALETHRQAELAVAMVGNDRRYLEGALQSVINAAATHRELLLLDSEIDWL